jgi:hypothetical protein
MHGHLPTYEYLEADSPPSGPCARLKPNSNSEICFPAAIRYLAALVAIKLQQTTNFNIKQYKAI